MTITEYAEQVDMWIKKVGIRYFDEKTNTLILMEEVGEFARLISRIYGEQSFKSGTEPNDQIAALEDEWADILFVLTCLANQTGIDINRAISNNIAKKTERDQNRHKNNKKLMQKK